MLLPPNNIAFATARQKPTSTPDERAIPTPSLEGFFFG